MITFSRDKGFVLERFEQGEFDYIDAVSIAFEAEFFSHIEAEEMLSELAASYPTPRQRHDVPLWVYIASDLSMRLHLTHSFEQFPHVIQFGGMPQAFGPQMGHKTTHPQTGDVTLSCEGFNDKNVYDRETPCDKDYLRKMAKDTDAEQLRRWFNTDVLEMFNRQGALDNAGIFVGDATYLFVPDNDKYEGSVKLRFDHNDHPVSRERFEQMSDEQKARCEWRRCYKLVSLLHTDRSRSFSMVAAFALLPGNASESSVLYDLVDEVVEAVGSDVIQRLILDRGFLDGEQIGRMKLAHSIDTLIPLRSDMLAFEDVKGLAKLHEDRFRPYDEASGKPSRGHPNSPKPPQIQRREEARQKTLSAQDQHTESESPEQTVVRREVAGFPNNEMWESCPVPVHVTLCRDEYADGHTEMWALVDTKPFKNRQCPAKRRALYAIRVDIEERHRQKKCFWDLCEFSSPAFSLIMNQVVFVMLTHNLIQWYLRRRGRTDLARKTPQSVLSTLQPTQRVVVIYCEQRFTMITPMQLLKISLQVPDSVKPKLLRKIEEIEDQLSHELEDPRPPP